MGAGRARADAQHPTDPRLSGVYGTILFERARPAAHHQRNVTIFADGEVDRSPCGSGTCARLATLHAAGALAGDAELWHDSIVGSRFVGRVRESVEVDGRTAVIPASPARRTAPASTRSPSTPTTRSSRASCSGDRVPRRRRDPAPGVARRPRSQAIRQALLDGLDPADDPPRTIVDVPAGQLLLMPSSSAAAAGVKLATVAPGNAARGRPRVQALYVLLDAETLTPQAVLDGTALTALRTPAVSVAAVQAALPERPAVVVFGAGPQAAGTSPHSPRPARSDGALRGARPEPVEAAGYGAARR